MYAIISSGDKQFKVKAGDFIRVHSLEKTVQIKSTINLAVLAIEEDDKFQLGNPELKTVSVSAIVLRHGLAKKILVFKKKRRKGYRRTQGHRQTFTELEITKIKTASGRIFISEKKVLKNNTSDKKISAKDSSQKTSDIKTKVAKKEIVKKASKKTTKPFSVQASKKISAKDSSQKTVSSQKKQIQKTNTKD